MLLYVVVAPLDERADRRGRRVEDGDFVLFDDLPESAFVGIIRRAFVHDDGRAGGEWAIDDVTVARDPADVGGAPEDVVITMVEDPLECLLYEEVVAGGRVFDALGFTGRTARIEDVEW